MNIIYPIIIVIIAYCIVGDGNILKELKSEHIVLITLAIWLFTVTMHKEGLENGYIPVPRAAKLLAAGATDEEKLTQREWNKWWAHHVNRSERDVENRIIDNVQVRADVLDKLFQGSKLEMKSNRYDDIEDMSFSSGYPWPESKCKYSPSAEQLPCGLWDRLSGRTDPAICCNSGGDWTPVLVFFILFVVFWVALIWGTPPAVRLPGVAYTFTWGAFPRLGIPQGGIDLGPGWWRFWGWRAHRAWPAAARLCLLALVPSFLWLLGFRLPPISPPVVKIQTQASCGGGGVSDDSGKCLRFADPAEGSDPSWEDITYLIGNGECKPKYPLSNHKVQKTNSIDDVQGHDGPCSMIKEESECNSAKGRIDAGPDNTDINMNYISPVSTEEENAGGTEICYWEKGDPTAGAISISNFDPISFGVHTDIESSTRMKGSLSTENDIVDTVKTHVQQIKQRCAHGEGNPGGSDHVPLNYCPRTNSAPLGKCVKDCADCGDYPSEQEATEVKEGEASMCVAEGPHNSLPPHHQPANFPRTTRLEDTCAQEGLPCPSQPDSAYSDTYPQICLREDGQEASCQANPFPEIMGQDGREQNVHFHNAPHSPAVAENMAALGTIQRRETCNPITDGGDHGNFPLTCQEWFYDMLNIYADASGHFTAELATWDTLGTKSGLDQGALARNALGRTPHDTGLVDSLETAYFSGGYIFPGCQYPQPDKILCDQDYAANANAEGPTADGTIFDKCCSA